MNKMMIQQIKKMFPNNSKLNSAIDLAEKELQGATPSEAGNILAKLGIDQSAINSIYNKYANNPASAAVLAMLGTSADKLKSDALNLVGDKDSQQPMNREMRRGASKSGAQKRFPKLK